MNNIQNIFVFGIGAAGSNTFLHMLYTYPTLNFTVIDDDIIEDRNIEPGTQPYTKTDLRRPKIQALQRISMMLKNKKINGIKKRIESVKEVVDIVGKNSENSIIIDAFDNAISRNLFTSLKINTNIFHIGFSAVLSGEGVWDNTFEPMETSPKDSAIDVCEMTLARPFIFALSSMSAIVLNRFIEKNEKINFYMDVNLNVKHWK